MWVNFLRTCPAYERCKFFCPAFIVVSLQWGESCPNVCAFTLIQKRSFNCIFKPELENQLSNALFVFFVEDGFSSLSLLKTICFLLAQQWLTEHWLGHFGKILSDPRESVSLPCISHSACTGTLCHWVVIIDQWVTEGSTWSVSARYVREGLCVSLPCCQHFWFDLEWKPYCRGLVTSAGVDFGPFPFWFNSLHSGLSSVSLLANQ